ncbi:MAG: IMS domain-containing protein [Prochloraceae cyanobacterium]|nr:IMS domain-containing protein [Prochloraceae cyanobacterium]
MRIPLDYYRIIGIPIQATDEQLTQAYRDRSSQLPRREYSNYSVKARKKLIEEAYQVLSNPEKRGKYNAKFLEKTYQLNSQAEQIEPGVKTVGAEKDLSFKNRTPSIDINPDEFVGALLILQELGEYELVLRLGAPYLRNLKVESPEREIQKAVRADIVLTLTLAYLELGREQWQQNNYENAATSGEMGLNLLRQEKLFPSVTSEIQNDLDKLRPYLILELLSGKENNLEKRTKGKDLLKQMLRDRGGIEGTQEDRSGLGIDEFLRFIQQLRAYLSVGEQQELFEAEAQRPSPVAAYLAIYALLAGGFACKQPALILRAKEMLQSLSKEQDVYLEEAVCSLLLGQTEAATVALEQSQEYEPIAFIREHSQNSPDLLPGLCLYAERWLQTEVFSHFRDLNSKRISLKEYFGDRNVQHYLEQLSQPTKLELERVKHKRTVARRQKVEQSLKEKGKQEAKPIKPLQEAYANIRSRFTQKQNNAGAISTVKSRTMTLSASPINSSGASLSSFTKLGQRLGSSSSQKAKNNSSNGHSSSKKSRSQQPAPQQTPSTRSLFLSANGKETDTDRNNRRSKIGKNKHPHKRSKKTKRLLMLGVPLSLSLAVVGFSYKWLEMHPTSSTLSEKEKLDNSNGTLVEAAEPNLQPTETSKKEEILNEEIAKQVIQTWLTSKSQAFGSTYKIDRLNSILTEPILPQWRDRAQNYQRNNVYRQYQHAIEVKSVEINQQNPQLAKVTAKVTETAKHYQGGRLSKAQSYNDNLLVRYDLVREKDRWLIENIKVLP